jgi:hypothetical protein
VKKAGCFLLLALPTIAYLLTVYSGASHFEAASKVALEKLAEEDRRRATPKPATLAEARRIAGEKAERQRAADLEEIGRLLRTREDELARKAAALAAGEDSRNATCRAVAWSPTQQSESSAWWNVDFECLWPGARLPDKRSLTVRLAKKGEVWRIE